MKITKGLKAVMNSLQKTVYQQYQIVKYALGYPKKYLTETTKPAWRIFLEMQAWLWQEGEINSMYYAWGLNQIESQQTQFIGKKRFIKYKNLAEVQLKRKNNLGSLCYDVVTKDKFINNSYLLANGIPCIPHYGIIANGAFIPIRIQIGTLETLLLQHKDLFIKSIALEASEGILHCQVSEDGLLVNSSKSSIQELNQMVASGIWLIQPRIASHKAIQAMNRSALNTTRIVTILENGFPRYLTGFQAFATGFATTDTWSSGSIYVGIDVEKGCLKEYGFYNLSDKANSICKKHPDSGILFQNYHIPFLSEAVDLCVKAHKLLYNNFIVGWDVAITDQGPLIVEANEKPGLGVVQLVDKGIRHAFQM